METLPYSLRFASTALIAVLAGISAMGAGSLRDTVIAAVLSTLFVAVYLVGVFRGRRRQAVRISARRWTTLWLLVLSTLWCGLLVLSSSSMWLAFPLILLHVAVLGIGWGSLAAALTCAATVVVSMSRVAPGQPIGGAILGPVLGAGIAVVLMWGAMTVAQESLARKHTLEELTATRKLLAEAEQDQIVAIERQRLAGEIHDTVSQGLSATAMLLRAAQASHDPQHARRLVTQALAATEDALAESRRVTQALAPRELSGSRLADALKALAQEPGATGLDITFEGCDSTVELELAHEAALLRVAQSALANVKEHSGVSAATITLHHNATATTLTIADEGHGFSSHGTQVPGRGIGLTSMQARMREVGGQLHVISNEAGTIVRATIPHGVEVSQP